jgi:Holliday junction resolvasome RuvABC endonuclease subunit
MGIDQSYTSTGYCISNGLGPGKMTNFGLISSDKTDDIFARARYVADELSTIINTHAVDVVALEGLAFGAKGDATRNLAGLQFTIVNMLFTDHNKSCEIYAPGTIKKIATGKGNSPKSLLLESLPAETKTRFADAGIKKTKGLLDLVDAYWIVQTAISQHTGTTNK